MSSEATAMALYMASTQIASERTAAEISRLLTEGGARRITMDYDEQGAVTALGFEIEHHGATLPFSLPINVEPVFRLMQKNRPISSRRRLEDRDREQARRTAWRIVMRWVQAQLAIIETEMVSTVQVFMPYLCVDQQGTSLFEALASGDFKALPAPKGVIDVETE